MTSSFASLFGPRRPKSSRRDSARSRQARRFAPRPELLEGRITPTVNLAITAASVVDSNDKALTTVNIGESVFIQINYTTLNLPSNASYRAEFTVNGRNLYSGQVTYGAGSSGSGSWYFYWGAWGATPGMNDVSATIDPDHSVAESSYADNTMSFSFNAVAPVVGSISYSAAQIRAAYGISSLPNFGSAAADGSGQTIALVEAGNEPTIISDLDGFDQAMSLTMGSTPTIYQQYGAAASLVTVYNQSGANITPYIANSGSNGVPLEDPTGHWEGEETLDVEWSHAIAPGAKIDIIEVPDDSTWGANVLAGDKLAASLPGVSAISNSFGLTEWSGETAYDSSTFVTPAGHTGVTFLTASNDNGSNVYPSPPNSPPPTVGNNGYYPATSPNVVSVGGTELTLNNDAYGSEIGWSFPAPTTIDDEGGTSYNQSGTWASQSGGFSGTYSTATGGSTSSASWTMPITTANTGFGTELSATWSASTSNATNATYTIYDGSQSTGTILGTVTVDQTKAPMGTVVGSSRFQELGVFFPTLATGGTGTLTIVLNARSANGKVVADAIGSADGWASTGGPTPFEAEPSYQLPFQSTGFRTTPDVSFDASENSGVDTYQDGNLGGGGFGTSLGSPCWAGLIAIVNQGRVANGYPTLNSSANPTQTLQALYSLPSQDYHDITSGYNGFNDTAGYDLVTGLGTPIVNLLVPDLVSYDTTDHLVVTAQPPASVTAGSGFGLTITVEDPSGDPATNFNGSVTIGLAQNPGGGTLGGTLTVSAINGVASFSGLTLDIADPGYIIQANSNGLPSATTSSFSVVAGAAYVRAISAQPPSTVTAGAGFGLAVTVEDAFGNVVTSYTGGFTVSLSTNPGGSVLGGTLTVSAVGGVATFSGLTLNKADPGYILGVSTAGLAARSPTPITVVAAAASQLVIMQQPNASVVAGVGFGFQVAVEDPYGNLESSDNATSVTAALATGTGPLQGTTTVTDLGGLATFVGLIDDKAETISLNASAVILKKATSNLVVVSPSAATKLVIQTQPSATAGVGQVFASQPVIDEEDQYGNLETGDSSTIVTGSLASGTGPLQGTTTAVVSGGVARFTNLADKKIETITLKFAAGTLIGATSNSIVVNKATTTVAWSPSAATATYKQAITLTAAVAATSGGASPTGSITFLDGSTVLGTSTLDSTGHASFSTASLLPGTQSITATYSGDPNYASATSPTKPLYVGDLPKGDYDGDGKADVAVYDQTSATFEIIDSGGGSLVVPFGTPGHVNIPVAGDYDGDGKTDLAIYDQTAAVFIVAESTGKSLFVPFGTPGHVNIPVAGDYDGDGKTDLAIYDQTAAVFIVAESGGKSLFVPFGTPGHVNIPVPGDYDGDGKTDLAIYDQTAAVFIVAKSGGKSLFVPFGTPGHVNIPLAGDYDGDGKTDLAIYDQTADVLIVAESGGGSIFRSFGPLGDVNIPIAGDFEGYGQTNIAIYDATAGEFFVVFPDGGSLVMLFGNKKHTNIPI